MSKKKINSRRKGSAGELEAAHFIQRFGFEARRGQQFSGTETSADVVHNIPGFHLEVKRVERGNPYDWLEQCERDRAQDDMPLVMHRRNREQWICVMYAEDLLYLLAQMEDQKVTIDELERTIAGWNCWR